MAKGNERVSKSEKIANNFLLQLTYAILSSIVLLFVYNGRVFKYGNDIGLAMPAFLWTMFILMAIIGAVLLYLWKTKQKNTYKISAIYSFITSAGFFWCIGLEKIAYYLGNFIPFFKYFANAERSIKYLFIIIGLSIPIGIANYFFQVRKIKSRKINMFKTAK